ncbi:MAG: hypothetical protein WC312_03905 [Candidatus Omnitrophota bacterium]|jgi:hypothetical protein
MEKAKGRKVKRLIKAVNKTCKIAQKNPQKLDMITGLGGKENPKGKRTEKLGMPICCYCHKPYDSSKDNYGWHINKKGELERCMFPVKFMTNLYFPKEKRLSFIAIHK